MRVIFITADGLRDWEDTTYDFNRPPPYIRRPLRAKIVFRLTEEIPTSPSYREYEYSSRDLRNKTVTYRENLIN